MSDIIYTEVGSSWCSCDGPDRWCDACKGRLPTGAAHKEACRVIAEGTFKRRAEDSAEIAHLYNLLDRAQKEAQRLRDEHGDLVVGPGNDRETLPITICVICGEEVRWVEIDCRGARERGEPMPKQQACRCCHGGDFFCNCGKPCFSFF